MTAGHVFFLGIGCAVIPVAYLVLAATVRAPPQNPAMALPDSERIRKPCADRAWDSQFRVRVRMPSPARIS